MSAVRPASRAAMLLLSLVVPAAAAGQTAAEPEDGSASAAPSPGSRHVEAPRPTLRLTLSLFEGLGRTAVVDAEREAGPGNDAVLGGGDYSEAYGALVYTKQNARSLFSAGANTAAMYDGRLRRLTATRQEANVRFSRETRRTQVLFGQSASSSPYFIFSPTSHDVATMPDDDPARTDGLAFHGATYSLASSVDVTRSLGRRSSLAFAYNRRSTETRSGPLNFATQGGAVRFTHRLSTFAAVRAGYGRQTAQYGVGSVASHDIDLGLDYQRSLSIAKRTRISFESGSSIVTDGRASHYGVVGRAEIGRPFARTWRARLSYERGVQMREGVTQPLFADGVAASAEGRLGRRIEVAVNAGASLGAVGFADGGNRYHSYNGLARVRMALTRRLSLDVQYYNQMYQFGQQAELLRDVARGIDQKGVRVGVSLAAPLLREPRVPTPRRGEGRPRRR